MPRKDTIRRSWRARAEYLERIGNSLYTLTMAEKETVMRKAALADGIHSGENTGRVSCFHRLYAQNARKSHENNPKPARKTHVFRPSPPLGQKIISDTMSRKTHILRLKIPYVENLRVFLRFWGTVTGVCDPEILRPLHICNITTTQLCDIKCQ